MPWIDANGRVNSLSKMSRRHLIQPQTCSFELKSKSNRRLSRRSQLAFPAPRLPTILSSHRNLALSTLILRLTRQSSPSSLPKSFLLSIQVAMVRMLVKMLLSRMRLAKLEWISQKTLMMAWVVSLRSRRGLKVHSSSKSSTKLTRGRTARQESS